MSGNKDKIEAHFDNGDILEEHLEVKRCLQGKSSGTQDMYFGNVQDVEDYIIQIQINIGYRYNRKRVYDVHSMTFLTLDT